MLKRLATRFRGATGIDWRAHRASAARGAIGRTAALAGFALIAVIADARGQNAASALTESAFFEELPVLSVSRLPQSVADAPGAVTVFDRDFIRATGYRDITRLLRLVPGFQVVNDRGHSALATYNGLGGDYSNRMQVLIDGRSVYSPSLAGGADWSGLPITIDEIERIEVLRGSNSTTYGSNAFQGVVNIITRHSRQDQGSAIGTRVGEEGLLDFSARHGGGNETMSYRIAANRLADRGFEKLEDNQRLNIVTLRTDLRLNPSDEATFWAGANDGTRINGFVGSPGNGMRTFTSRNRFAHLRWRRTLATDNELSVGVYHNDETIFEPLSIVPLEVNRQSTRDNIDFQHSFVAAQGLRVVWGAEGRRDWVQSQTAFFPTGEASSRLWRGFLNTEWRPWTALVINAGAMEEKYSGKTPRLAPRLFANWTVANGQTLRAGWTRAYREPALFEERGDLRLFVGPTLLQVYQYGPGTLRPERIRTSEIGWVSRYAPWNLTADVRVYWQNLSDLIDLRTAPPPAGAVALDPASRVYFNREDDVRIRGIELQLKARPTRTTEFMLGSAWVWINAGKLELDRTAPPASWNATWIQRYAGGLSSTLSFVSVGHYRWIGSIDVPSYRYVDARIAYAIRLGGKHAEIAGGVQNLGAHREEFQLGAAYTPRTPISRTFYVSARLEF